MAQTLEQRIEAAIRKNPDRTDGEICRNIFGGCRVHQVRAVRARMEGTPAPQEPADVPTNGGIPLGRLRVTTQRPADTAALRIKRLPSGQGFEPRILAAEWGITEDNVRKHAKDMKCLKYAELSPGHWVQLIMNPETAAKYS